VPEYAYLVWNVRFVQSGKITEREGNFEEQVLSDVLLVQHGDLGRCVAACLSYRLTLVINATDRLHAYPFRAA